MLTDERVMCWSRPERTLASTANPAKDAKHLRALWEAVPLRGATAFARASALAQAVCVQRAPTPVCLRELSRAENAVAFSMSPALAPAQALLMPSYDATVLCGVLAKERIRCDGQDAGKRGFPTLDDAAAGPSAPVAITRPWAAQL